MKHQYIIYIMKVKKKNLKKDYRYKIVQYVIIMKKYKDCKDNIL